MEDSPLSVLSLKEAKIWLKEAEETFKVGFYLSSRVSIYFAVLHAARSVTLRDGVEVEDPPPYLVNYLEK